MQTPTRITANPPAMSKASITDVNGVTSPVAGALTFAVVFCTAGLLVFGAACVPPFVMPAVGAASGAGVTFSTAFSVPQ